jgi:hypothetical protein
MTARFQPGRLPLIRPPLRSSSRSLAGGEKEHCWSSSSVPGLVERVLVALVSIIRLLANDLSRYISLQIEPPEGSSLIE